MVEDNAELFQERLAMLRIGDELKLVGDGVELRGQVTEFGWGVVHRMCRKGGVVIFSHCAAVWA